MFVKVLFSTLCMLALAQGDDAIVVVDGPSACFDEAALNTRIAYVERHNVATFGVARPWPMDALLP